MNIQLKPFDFAQAATKAGMPQVVDRVREHARAAGIEQEGGDAHGQDFTQVMAQALRSVSQAQQTAQQLQRDVATDNPAVSIEETMIAMQKAQIGFQAALQVRNRMVQAYSDIMNMQV